MTPLSSVPLNVVLFVPFIVQYPEYVKLSLSASLALIVQTALVPTCLRLRDTTGFEFKTVLLSSTVLHTGPNFVSFTQTEILNEIISCFDMLAFNGIVFVVPVPLLTSLPFTSQDQVEFIIVLLSFRCQVALIIESAYTFSGLMVKEMLTGSTFGSHAFTRYSPGKSSNLVIPSIPSEVTS